MYIYSCTGFPTFLFVSILGTDWVDPEDPTVIAENELLTAASSIEAAAKKLSQLQPRQKAKVFDNTHGFDGMVEAKNHNFIRCFLILEHFFTVWLWL